MLRRLVILIGMSWGPVTTQAQTLTDTIYSLEEVVVRAEAMLGSLHAAKHRTGASVYLDRRDLRAFHSTDIHRALQSVPGVSYYEEDGFGLRPNISIRGTSPERSAKVTIMEDGILISPAPYSAPAAYYFPSVARMEALEVVKGSSQIQYGPFTTGGAINLISTSIPDSFCARASARYGLFNTRQNQATIGKSSGQLGFLIEYSNHASDGFKRLPNGGPTGFNTSDFMVKLRASSGRHARMEQYLEFKFHQYKERSHETYLGVTQSDFRRDPFMRYAASQNDEMNARQTQYMMTHQARPGKKFTVTSQIYWNRVQRNWYKLDDVTARGETQSISNIMQQPEVFRGHLDVLRGHINTLENALWLKANNRAYTAYGAQSRWKYHWYGQRGPAHQIEIGLRWHMDQEDRLQWEDGYGIIAGELIGRSQGLLGAAGNRISATAATAVYALHRATWGKITVTPGLRYENMNMQRIDYGEADPLREGTDLTRRFHQAGIWVPGIGFHFSWTPQFAVFGGVHRGFSPPGNSPGQAPELSVNYELGGRFNAPRVKAEYTLFFNNYSNLLGSDLAASGGTGSLDQFNAGAVHVRGFECSLQMDGTRGKNFRLPIAFSYTLTDARFQSSFESSEDIWGTVYFGDRVPYIPMHQFNASLQAIFGWMEILVNGRYQGAMNTRAGELTEPLNPYFIVDGAIKWHLNPGAEVSIQAVNLFDQIYAAARVPAGFRPGHPFGLYTGLSIAF